MSQIKTFHEEIKSRKKMFMVSLDATMRPICAIAVGLAASKLVCLSGLIKAMYTRMLVSVLVLSYGDSSGGVLTFMILVPVLYLLK